MSDEQVFIMPDNNPNELLVLVIGILVFCLIMTLISILALRKRKKRLKEAQEKIKTYQQMLKNSPEDQVLAEV